MRKGFVQGGQACSERVFSGVRNIYHQWHLGLYTERCCKQKILICYPTPELNAGPNLTLTRAKPQNP